MFQKFLSKYGLATHLALLASAPLALTPFLDSTSLATVVLWLSAIAAIWLLAQPSIRESEHLSAARRRVRAEIVRDPFFWFLVPVFLFVLFRFLNSGIALQYDPEQTQWIVGAPRFGGGPASVGSSGLLSVAVCVAVFVVSMGLRHGIGLRARASFGVIGALIVGLGGLAAAGCACAQLKPFADWMRSGFGDNPFWASSFGVWLVLGLVSGVQAEVYVWRSARPAYIIGIAGTVAALLFFAPPLLTVAWLTLAFLMYVFSLAYLSRANSMGAVARNLSLAFIGFAIPVLLMMMFVPEAVREIKINGLDVELAFPEAYKETAETLSRISRRMWLSAPWFGIGSGAYGLHVPFLAEKVDWDLLPAQPMFAPNGYWTFLCECGIVGCLFPVVGLGMLLYTYISRLTSAFLFLRHKDGADIFPFAVSPVAWCACFVLALLAFEALVSPIFTIDTLFLTALTTMSLSAAAFPKSKATSDTSLEN